VLGIPVEGEEMMEALALLAVWDGRVSPDSPAASLYEFLLAELARELVYAHAPDAQEWFLGKSIHPLLYASLGKRQVSHLSRILRERREVFSDSREEAISWALSRALVKLKMQFGENPDSWVWGKIRPLTLEHPFGSQPLIGKVFNRGPFPWGGDSQTISQAQRSLKIPTHNPTGIANMRMVLDVGEWDKNTFVLAGGQSGNPFSRHYDDQLPLWQKGESLTLAWSESAIQEAAVASLRLDPVDGGAIED
jgi:penicillin amidase